MTTKEVKRTVYVSDDSGKEYESRKDCIGYEAAYYGVRMWDSAGKLTYDIDEALVIEIALDEQISVVQSWSDITKSIDTTGLYQWNGWKGQGGEFELLSPTMCLALYKAIKEQIDSGWRVFNG